MTFLALYGSTVFALALVATNYAPGIKADVYCLRCNNVLHPTECTTFKKCQPKEQCFIDVFLTVKGDITYELGCRETPQCDGVKPVRRRYGPDMNGNPRANSTRRTGRDPVLCSTCCRSQLCNSVGCGSNGFSKTRGPICSSCQNAENVESCSTLQVCRKHEVCMLLKRTDSMTRRPTYETKCEQEMVCNAKYKEFMNIYAMFIGQSSSAVLPSDICDIKCCKTDLCNNKCKQPSRANIQSALRPKQEMSKYVYGATPTLDVYPAEFVEQSSASRDPVQRESTRHLRRNTIRTSERHPNSQIARNSRRNMPVYDNLESPGILAALGISEHTTALNATNGRRPIRQPYEPPKPRELRPHLDLGTTEVRPRLDRGLDGPNLYEPHNTFGTNQFEKRASSVPSQYKPRGTAESSQYEPRPNREPVSPQTTDRERNPGSKNVMPDLLSRSQYDFLTAEQRRRVASLLNSFSSEQTMDSQGPGGRQVDPQSPIQSSSSRRNSIPEQSPRASRRDLDALQGSHTGGSNALMPDFVRMIQTREFHAGKDSTVNPAENTFAAQTGEAHPAFAKNSSPLTSPQTSGLERYQNSLPQNAEPRMKSQHYRDVQERTQTSRHPVSRNVDPSSGRMIDQGVGNLRNAEPRLGHVPANYPDAPSQYQDVQHHTEPMHQSTGRRNVDRSSLSDYSPRNVVPLGIKTVQKIRGSTQDKGGFRSDGMDTMGRNGQAADQFYDASIPQNVREGIQQDIGGFRRGSMATVGRNGQAADQFYDSSLSRNNREGVQQDMSRFGAGGMDFAVNQGQFMDQLYSATTMPSMVGAMDHLTPAPSRMNKIDPCLHNPCVRGTCLVKDGGYRCKCDPGSWGKICEHSLLEKPSNTTVKAKSNPNAPPGTSSVDPCFSNPCMRGECSSYHDTYRCVCDHGFYGRDCEKVSLGGAAFLGAMGLNIDACQAQATPCVHGNCTTANKKVACTCEPGYTGTTCSEVLDHCSSLPCIRGTCINGTSTFECVCPSGFNGVHCEDIDFCAATPCKHGTCANTADGYVCNCSPGYTGTHCEVVDHCSSSPCVRGRCSNRQFDFHCSCPAGYVGQRCEAVDYCFPAPCAHGTCVNSNTGYICNCPKGFKGLQCQTIDHCASNPCVRGDCENSDMSYSCVCPTGYIGKQCQTIDHCASKPCAHGTCLNRDIDYECKCPYMYTGKQCQIVNHCASSPCARGTCKNSNSGYTCECPPGYTGPTCLTVDHCYSTPCSHGTCLNSNTGYTCILSSGYIGASNSAVPPPVVAPNVNPLSHGAPAGQASMNSGQNFGPDYPPNRNPGNHAAAEYSSNMNPGHYLAPDVPSQNAHGAGRDLGQGMGPRMSPDVGPQGGPGGAQHFPIHASNSSPRLAEFHYSLQSKPKGFQEVRDHCFSNPCVRGECMSTDTDYRCVCPPGYTGFNCELLDHCASNPCVRGECLSSETDYKCVCPPGYTGFSCELRDHCASNPCVRGECMSSETGYKCVCPPGYTGFNCELLDHCASTPCVRGECMSSETGYKCVCPPGYTGISCELIDYCSPSPCVNGQCMSDQVGFQCHCPHGFIGTLCDIRDYCVSSPCYSGTCVSTSSGYHCACPSGMTGKHCETKVVVDNCASMPCFHGTCVSSSTGFHCNCKAGFTGTHCETDSYAFMHDLCASTPCMRGTCLNMGNKFLCSCPANFTGKRCETEVVVDNCASMPCFHGTCVSTSSGFQCNCKPGFTGTHCETDSYAFMHDLCASMPCMRGTCLNMGNKFLCSCPVNFTGKHCEINLTPIAPDFCDSKPCVRGTCISSKTGYECKCPPGISGTNCDVQDPCANSACIHGACVANGTSYTCDCRVGYSGKNCDVKDPKVGYCEANPGMFALCGHGTCKNAGDGYACACEPRYNGTHCLFQYLCFGGHVCFHDGTCVNNQYCFCRAGYSGDHCGTLYSHEMIQMKPGDVVSRGRDWDYGNQDGGLHSVGKVISLHNEYVNVMWVNGEKYHYKMGKGRYDLELAP